MSKGNKFSEQDLLNKGFVFDHESSQYVPRSITSPFIESIRGNVPKQENEPLAADIKLDIKTEWWITHNVPSLKNSKRIVPNKKTKRGYLILPSELHEQYEKATAMQYSVFATEFRRAVKFYGLTYPLKVEFTFVRSSKRSFDYGNCLQTCEDLMKDKKRKDGTIETRWIPDDSADYLLPVFQPYQYDKENPGVKIKLLVK